MSYIPNTEADRAAMRKAIGVNNIDELFRDVPEALRYPELKLPPPLSEMEILRELREISEYNVDLEHAPCFLGAGAYRHFVPSIVGHVIGRSEFYTAYTPYQPEISQGTLQSIFEYQSMICALTGMDVANASHYDGATALAEAVLMAVSVSRGKRHKVVLSAGVHPEYRAVVYTYTQGMGLTLVGEGADPLAIDYLADMVDADTACVVVQNPSFLGYLEDPAALRALAEAAHSKGALFVVSADPISLGLFAPPADYGADIVCGEGQALGGGLNFGGPYLGFFACKQQYVHKMAGRIVGQTVDRRGQRGFVLTLSAREQHIRREKATSNICSNEALMALAAAVYLAAMGKTGLRKVAELCYHKAHYAAQRLSALPDYHLLSQKPFFKEFALRCPKPVDEINEYLLDEWGIIGGYDLGKDYPGLANTMLVCVTEMNTKEEIDLLVDALTPNSFVHAEEQWESNEEEAA
ncbi:MAG: aminomethyl-transferring glycine dehydrogenase subunit GcvPA [Anaerolineae bacterium]